MAYGTPFPLGDWRNDARMARLSVEDLDNIAFDLRMKSFRGDVNAGLVADALDSVVRRRHAAELARNRRAAPAFVTSAWERVSAWANTK